MEYTWTPQKKLTLEIALNTEIAQTSDNTNRKELKANESPQP